MRICKQGVGPTGILSVGSFLLMEVHDDTCIFTHIQCRRRIRYPSRCSWLLSRKAADLQLPELQESQVFVDRGVSGAKFKERQGLQELLKYSVSHHRSGVHYWYIDLIG